MYAPGGYEAYFRVVLPLKCDRPDGRYQVEMSWRELFSLAGVSFTATSQLREIPREVREQWQIMRTDGSLEWETARALSAALTSATATPDRCAIALWPGRDWWTKDMTPLVREREESEPSFIDKLGYELFDCPLSWCYERPAVHVESFPDAIWPLDRAFVLARWVYADSVYVSGTRHLGNEIARAGFDVFEVSRGDVDVSEGDIVKDD